MKKKRNNIFRDNLEVREQMIKEYNSGMSSGKLALKYKVSPKTVLKYCSESSILQKKRRGSIMKTFSRKQPTYPSFRSTSQNVWVDEKGEKVNKGHNYDYYLRNSYPHLGIRK